MSRDNNAKVGMPITLIRMVDDPRPVKPNTAGVIQHIDDIGTLHVKWEDGRVLGVIPGVDEYHLGKA